MRPMYFGTEEIVERQKRGSQWIEDALRRYEKPLIRRALRVTGDIELARDIVQDAFLRLCNADREKVEQKAVSWLYTVVRNRAIDVMKKENRMNRFDDARVIPDTESLGPHDVASKKEIHRLVLEAIETLNETEKEAILLKFQDGLSYREISQVMGKSLGSVSRLMSVALQTVRDYLNAKSAFGEEG